MGSTESTNDLQQSATAPPLTAQEGCEAGADRVVDRLEEFLAELPDISAQDFLGLEEIDGLTSFQNDVAATIADTTNQSSTLCDLDGFQALVAERINDVERNGVLPEFLIATIRDGRELTTADLAVSPGDDVEAVLGLLDNGSTLTFAPGTYELARPLLLTRSVTIIGAGVDETIISSTSADAAIVIVGQGELIMRDVRVEHVGDAVASVILSFNRPLDVADVHLSGGIADEDGGAGNGLVLTDETFGAAPLEPAEPPRSVIANAVIADNAGAGIALSGAVNPSIENSEIARNGVCGICFFGAARGAVANSFVHENDFGMQIGDQATPRFDSNTISQNVTAGMVVLGTAAPVIAGNTFEANREVAIAIQEASSPMLSGNTFRDNPFGISVLSTGQVVVQDNDITGGDIGIQVDETSAPLVQNNRLSDTSAVGIAITGTAAGDFLNNDVQLDDGVGVVVDSQSTPLLDGLSIRGGVVGVAYAASAGGTLTNSSFDGPDIGVQLDEQADPAISNLSITNAASAGLVARGESAATVTNTQVVDAVEVGFALADDSALTLDDVSVRGAATGASIIGMSTATVRSSTFEDTDVGVQVGENATPVIEENDVIAASSAAFVFVGESGGTAARNRVRDPGIVGFQIGDSASPDLDANVLFSSMPDDPQTAGSEAQDQDEEADADSAGDGSSEVADGEPAATVGILFAGESSGTASDNQIVGFVIGIQAGESSTPQLTRNAIDGGALLGIGVLFRDAAGGGATSNETSAHSVGFQIGDDSVPVIDGNTVVTASNVAFLVQGSASPVLTNNTCPDGLAGIGLLDGADPQRTDNACTEAIGEG